MPHRLLNLAKPEGLDWISDRAILALLAPVQRIRANAQQSNQEKNAHCSTPHYVAHFYVYVAASQAVT